MDILITIVPALILIILSALFSGLTLGLMSLDPYELERKAKLGNKYAASIYPIRKRGNELLTVLLLCNAAVNSALSIFLSSLASGIVAGLLATALIFVFGEVIPQASIARHALRFGAFMAPVVRALLFIMYPIACPFAYLLNKILGHELPTRYSKQELVEIIAEHESEGDGVIDADERRIVKHALTFSEKKTEQIMTPRTVVLTLPESTPINDETLARLKSEGYSRIPVYGKTIDDVTGILVLKNMLGAVSGTLAEYKKPAVFVSETMKLDELKNAMLKSHQHMAVVQDEFGGFSGVVTLEDILEEVIGVEIMDEGDEYEDLRVFAKSKVG